MHFFILNVFGKLLTQDNPRDRKLMLQISDKNPEALSQLYDLYAKLLFGIIKSILKKKEEAEDILQEVFTSIWEKADQFDAASGSPYSWLVTIARNKAIDRLRSKVYKEQQKQASSLNDDNLHIPLFSKEKNPLENTILSERAHQIYRALEKLTEKQRVVIQVAYFDGLSQTEIAEHFNLPLGTVKTRMRDGMINLRSILSKEEV